MTLHDIRRQIADGELAPAAEAALDYAEKSGVAEAVNSLTAARAALEQTRQLWNSGQLSFEEYARQHARSTQALLDCLDRLPERPTPGAARRMLREEVFKGRLLWMLALGKVLVLGRLGYHWSTGGFNDEQGWACMGILAPTFAAYLYVVLDDYLRAHREPSAPQRYVSGALVRFAYVIIPVYILALLFLMEKKVMPPHLPFAQMTAGFALVESVLGGYVSRVVSTFLTRAPVTA
ncbi:MAG: hypothetical protein IPH12_06310 [Saprospirales bacterium]|nr:hypothetical protein [Saprospirales bacterium]